MTVSYTCANPHVHEGKVVGDGHCVAFIRAFSGAPQTTLWAQGQKVRGSSITPSRAIATFKNGKYESNATGNHAAFYVSQDETGIWVWDQWLGQPVHKRLIRFKGGQGSPSNDGDAYSVIE